MNTMPCTIPAQPRHELRFESLFDSGRALVFPCDGRGQVVLDDLSRRALQNYLFARAVVGREYGHPVVTRQAARE